MIEYYTEFWKNYFNFQGRARRSEYWYTWLMNIIIITVLSVLKAFVPKLSFLYGLYGLAVLIPQISLSVRRLHDTGKSGLWLLAGLLPAAAIELLILFGGYSVVFFVGSHPVLVSLVALIPVIVLIVFFCQDSDSDNYYGPSPKYSSESEPMEHSYAATESSFYKRDESQAVPPPAPERSFYNKPKVEETPKKGFYNRDKIEPKQERSFYKK